MTLFSFIKRLVLYVYILVTRYRRRAAIIGHVARWSRPQKHVALQNPYLPDSVDDIYGLPEGWSDDHTFTAFDRNGTCFVYRSSKANNLKRELYINIPAEGTFMYSENDTDEVDDGIFINKQRIKCDVNDPMTKWEISYRGHMKMVSDRDENCRRTFVKCHFYWKAYRDPHDILLKTSAWQIAGEFSKLSFSHSRSYLNSVWFEQWGELRGTLQVEEHEYNLRTPACRERLIAAEHSFKRQLSKIESTYIEIDEITHKYAYKTIETKDKHKLNFSHVLYPALEGYSAKQEKHVEKEMKFRLCGKEVIAKETLKRDLVQNNNISIQYRKYSMDGRSAAGITFSSQYDGSDELPRSQAPKTLSNEGNKANEDVLVVDIADPACRDKELVGAKAANLHALINFGFSVPPAFCKTTSAFKLVLKQNVYLAEAIQQILNVIHDKKFDMLKEACENTCQMLKNIQVDSKVQEQIFLQVNEQRSLEVRGVAVRSSAIGEDGEILSAAGQMETILDVRRKDQLIDAIKQCWTSYFTFQSVEYRRQNGQKIIDGMGVIIQEMVQSDVSGVLMTNDPLTGREDRIIVSSCFGLGDGVVSGKGDVDTFVVDVHNGGDFQISKQTVGMKVNRTDGLSIPEKSHIESSIKDNCSLSNNWVYRICSVGKEIESKFRHEQEVEWAIKENTLYILQARPVTSIDCETDDDLLHEFDTRQGGERELFTTCNIQEMMPGATTPLTTEYFTRVLDWAYYYTYYYKTGGEEYLHHPTGLFPCYKNSHFVNMSAMYVMAVQGVAGLKAKAFVDIAVIGEECKESTIEDIMNFKGTPLNSFSKFLWYSFSKMLFYNPQQSKAFIDFEKIMHTYSVISNDTDESKLLYGQIDSHTIDQYRIWQIYLHLLTNIPASIMQNILMGGSPNFTRDNQEDISRLLTGTGAISSEVPKAIEKLAMIVERNEMKNIFLETNDQECLQLIARDEETNKSFTEFMRNHGHRGIREAEFIERSWSQDPAKVVKSMKTILVHGASGVGDKNLVNCVPLSETMKTLKTKVSPVGRWLIEKVFLPKARNKVSDRERGKSFVVKITEAFKKAYWSLADRLVREGRIPDEELMFFLTHREIGELIETRSPKLIRKAKRRMRLFPLQQEARYERLSFGGPKHKFVAQEPIEPLEISVTIEGYPMGHGEATGRACVILSEADVSQIEKGDILICQYTDVGWSPYFPLISGLVTEIGSILSHGAVVARECGIPCIVNVMNATRKLKTGDVVKINGTKGTLEKLSNF